MKNGLIGAVSPNIGLKIAKESLYYAATALGQRKAYDYYLFK